MQTDMINDYKKEIKDLLEKNSDSEKKIVSKKKTVANLDIDIPQLGQILEKLNTKIKLDEYQSFESDIHSIEKQMKLPSRIGDPLFECWHKMGEELVAVRNNGLELKKTVGS